MHKNCPGTLNIITPELKIKQCPVCGREVEIFSDETEARCAVCGKLVYNDIQSCVQWCRYALDCVGEEVYSKLRKPDKKQEYVNE